MARAGCMPSSPSDTAGSFGHGTVALLMQRAGVAGVTGRPRFRRIPGMATASDLVERHFGRDDPDRLWVTDIERHEALTNRAMMKGHRRQSVAEDWMKLEAA